MLAKRIIPCLDVNEGMVVKGVRFNDIKNVGDPVALADDYAKKGADELVFYDIKASFEARNTFLDVVERIAKNISIPFTVGGGVRTLDDFKRLMHVGADKVSINSAAIQNPSLIEQAAKKYGSQCVVLSIDIKKNKSENYTVFINGGRQKTALNALDWAKQGVQLGAGEIVVNVIDTDGVKAGYDCIATGIISKGVDVPVIASGGAGSQVHFSEVFTKGFADAALAASVFHYNTININSLKRYLSQCGLPVRI